MKNNYTPNKQHVLIPKHHHQFHVQSHEIKSKGFKVITATGDIFGPTGTGALARSDFQSDLAFDLAMRERAGRVSSKGQIINVSIENIFGLDPKEISRALSDELNNKASI